MSMRYELSHPFTIMSQFASFQRRYNDRAPMTFRANTRQVCLGAGVVCWFCVYAQEMSRTECCRSLRSGS